MPRNTVDSNTQTKQNELMTEQQFIETLKPMVRYDKENKLHYMGSTILTTKEMDYILKNMIIGFSQLSLKEQKKMRQRVFKECT